MKFQCLKSMFVAGIISNISRALPGCFVSFSDEYRLCPSQLLSICRAVSECFVSFSDESRLFLRSYSVFLVPSPSVLCRFLTSAVCVPRSYSVFLAPYPDVLCGFLTSAVCVLRSSAGDPPGRYPDSGHRAQTRQGLGGPGAALRSVCANRRAGNGQVIRCSPIRA